MKKTIYILLIILFSLSATADNTDSLIQMLLKSSEKEKYEVFRKLIRGYLGNNTDSARFFARQYLDYAIENKNPEHVSIAHRLIGSSYYYEGDLSKSEEYVNKSYAIAKRNNIKEQRAAAANNLAIIHSLRGYYKKAIQNYTEALEIYKEKKNDDKIGLILLNIGNIHYNTDDPVKALSYFKEVIDIALEIDEQKLLSTAYNNTGNAYEMLDSLEKAKKFYSKAITMKRELNDIRGSANSLNNLANTYKISGDLKNALFTAKEALKNHTELKNNSGIMISKNTVGDIFMDMGNLDSAIVYLMESLELSQNLDFIEYERSNFLSISECFAKMNDYKMAYEFHKKYKYISDSILSREERKHIKELAAKFESEKMKNTISNLEEEQEAKESVQMMLVIFVFLVLIIAVIIYIQLKTKARANKLLEEKNRLIEKQKEEFERLNIELSKSNERLITLNENLVLSQKELKETNATKDKFFSIVAHDLKNSIASFLTSSELITLYYDKLDKDKILQQLNRMNSGALNLRTLLENLVHWANSKTGKLKPELEKVNMKQLIDQSISANEQSAINKSIIIEKHVNDDDFAIGDPNMLKTVLRNLISNAIKFTESNGSIKVTSEFDNGKVKVSVKDTGIGMTEDDMKKLFNLESHFTKKGTNNEAGTGLGLILCKEFIELNNGEIFVESKQGDGSNFIFTLNKS